MIFNFLGLLFAPVFVILMHYFEFSDVVSLYLVLAIIFFIYKLIKKSSLKDMLMPSIYVVALSVAYYFSSLDAVKYIPVTLSMIFLLLFVDAYINKKKMILGFTRKFYKKELSSNEIEFIKKGDGYWVVVMLINTAIHLYIINYSSNAVWAFYSSIGWYIYFLISLFIQIIYGKVYAIDKFKSKEI